jgi:hypothetical protein
MSADKPIWREFSGWGRDKSCENMAKRFKKGLIVITPLGKGEVIRKETHYTVTRWGVKLEAQTDYRKNIAYFYPSEITNCV